MNVMNPTAVLYLDRSRLDEELFQSYDCALTMQKPRDACQRPGL